MDFEENSLYQEGIISKFYQTPDKPYFQEPRDQESLINTGKLVQKFLPKQADIDKILMKGTQRYASISYDERNSGRIFD